MDATAPYVSASPIKICLQCFLSVLSEDKKDLISSLLIIISSGLLGVHPVFIQMLNSMILISFIHEWQKGTMIQQNPNEIWHTEEIYYTPDWITIDRLGTSTDRTLRSILKKIDFKVLIPGESWLHGTFRDSTYYSKLGT